LRGARLDRGHDPVLEHPGPQPTPKQPQHPPIAHPSLDLSDQGVQVDLVNAALDVGVEHPLLAPQVTVCLTVSKAWWADSRWRNP
jgi:hypothetical protein